jgi:hypothetical protein
MISNADAETAIQAAPAGRPAITSLTKWNPEVQATERHDDTPGQRVTAGEDFLGKCDEHGDRDRQEKASVRCIASALINVG